MNDEIKKFLQENYFGDLAKPEINIFERAKIIQEYMKEHNLSMQQFAEKFHIPKSTVQNWLVWNKITPDEHEELIRSGTPHSVVYRSLREPNSKYVEKASVRDIFDTYIDDFNTTVGRALNKHMYFTIETEDKILQLINKLNRVRIVLDKSEKLTKCDLLTHSTKKIDSKA